MDALCIRPDEQTIPSQRPRDTLLLIGPQFRRRWRTNEHDVAAAGTDSTHGLGGPGNHLIGHCRRDARPLEAVPGVPRMALEVGIGFDLPPHAELAAGER